MNIVSGVNYFSGDHPRIRGTNNKYVDKLMLRVGSSPHTRDKFENTALLIVAGGIIPAYAGQILKDPLK